MYADRWLTSPVEGLGRRLGPRRFLAVATVLTALAVAVLGLVLGGLVDVVVRGAPYRLDYQACAQGASIGLIGVPLMVRIGLWQDRRRS